MLFDNVQKFLSGLPAFCHLANPGPRVGPVTCTPSRPAAAEEKKKEMPIKTDAAAIAAGWATGAEVAGRASHDLKPENTACGD